MIFLLVGVFVIINIIQVWLLLFFQNLIIGGILVGLTEAFEFSLMIYLFLKKELITFLLVILVEVLEWLSVAYFSGKGKIK